MAKNKNSNEYLVICQEQIKGKGEDFFLFEVDEDRLIMGVFDGCGGSGARIYPAFDGRTGAKVASRALAGAVKLWFQEYMQKNRPEETLKMITEKMLKTCKERQFRTGITWKPQQRISKHDSLFYSGRRRKLCGFLLVRRFQRIYSGSGGTSSGNRR